MIIGGDFNNMSFNIHGLIHSWIANNPDNFIIKDRNLVFLPDICRENFLVDSFLLEIPFIWEKGFPVKINRFGYSSLFFIPGEKVSVDRIIFIMKIKANELESLTPSQLTEKARSVVGCLINETMAIKSSSVSGFLMDLHFAAQMLGISEFIAHVGNSEKSLAY